MRLSKFFYIVIILIFIPNCVFAEKPINLITPKMDFLVAMSDDYYQQDTGATGTLQCDDCSGSTTFSSHFENNDDVTQGTPCGCSDGDTTLALTGVTYSATQAFDGSYSLYKPSNSNYYAQVSVTSRAEFDEQDGTVTFWIYTVTYSYGQVLFYAQYDGTNYCSLSMNQTGSGMTVRGKFCTAGSCDYLNIGSDKPLNTWVKVVYKFKTGVAGNDHSIAMYDSDGSNEIIDTQDHDLVAWAGSATYFEIFRNASGSGVAYIDKFSVTKNDSGF